MGHLARFLRRLITSFRSGREEAGLEREIASHLLLLEDDYRRRGLSPDEARRAARIALGGAEQTKERHRDARAFRWLDNARRDVTYAMRTLRRHPVATATAALSLAVGIGLNAAVFSVIDWALLRPLRYPASHELVRVFTAGTAPVTSPSPLTYDEFVIPNNCSAIWPRAPRPFRAVTRFSTQVAATFAGLALLLSMIGVYGLTAGEVSAKWRELAVRLALGCVTPRRVLDRDSAVCCHSGSWSGTWHPWRRQRWAGARVVAARDRPRRCAHPGGRASPARCHGNPGCSAGSQARATSGSRGDFTQRIGAGPRLALAALSTGHCPNCSDGRDTILGYASLLCLAHVE